uniref:Uncharacterized protein n=1 Tax=Phlebotomus papatasi TaxID=29031 RepID=A0A1B0D5D6_PHLPP
MNATLLGGKLTYLKKNGKNRIVYNTRGVSVKFGKDLSCHFRLKHPEALRVHCKIFMGKFGKVQVKNYSEEDSVQVNGKGVNGKCVLRPGDFLKVFNDEFLWNYMPLLDDSKSLATVIDNQTGIGKRRICKSEPGRKKKQIRLNRNTTVSVLTPLRPQARSYSDAYNCTIENKQETCTPEQTTLIKDSTQLDASTTLQQNDTASEMTNSVYATPLEVTLANSTLVSPKMPRESINLIDLCTPAPSKLVSRVDVEVPDTPDVFKTPVRQPVTRSLRTPSSATRGNYSAAKVNVDFTSLLQSTPIELSSKSRQLDESQDDQSASVITIEDSDETLKTLDDSVKFVGEKMSPKTPQRPFRSAKTPVSTKKTPKKEELGTPKNPPRISKRPATSVKKVTRRIDVGKKLNNSDITGEKAARTISEVSKLMTMENLTDITVDKENITTPIAEKTALRTGVEKNLLQEDLAVEVGMTTPVVQKTPSQNVASEEKFRDLEVEEVTTPLAKKTPARRSLSVKKLSQDDLEVEEIMTTPTSKTTPTETTQYQEDLQVEETIATPLTKKTPGRKALSVKKLSQEDQEIEEKITTPLTKKTPGRKALSVKKLSQEDQEIEEKITTPLTKNTPARRALSVKKLSQEDQEVEEKITTPLTKKTPGRKALSVKKLSQEDQEVEEKLTTPLTKKTPARRALSVKKLSQEDQEVEEKITTPLTKKTPGQSKLEAEKAANVRGRRGKKVQNNATTSASKEINTSEATGLEAKPEDEKMTSSATRGRRGKKVQNSSQASTSEDVNTSEATGLEAKPEDEKMTSSATRGRRGKKVQNSSQASTSEDVNTSEATGLEAKPKDDKTSISATRGRRGKKVQNNPITSTSEEVNTSEVTGLETKPEDEDMTSSSTRGRRGKKVQNNPTTSNSEEVNTSEATGLEVKPEDEKTTSSATRGRRAKAAPTEPSNPAETPKADEEKTSNAVTRKGRLRKVRDNSVVSPEDGTASEETQEPPLKKGRRVKAKEATEEKGEDEKKNAKTRRGKPEVESSPVVQEAAAAPKRTLRSRKGD